MPVLQAYSRRVVAIILLSFLALFVIRALRGSIGFLGYAMTLVVVVIVIFVVLVRRTWKDFPRELDTASEQATTLIAQIDKICDAIPHVVRQNRWKLIEADSANRHFKVRIPASMATLGGQEMLIELKRSSEGSTIINVRCEALHQTIDWGANKKNIDKFLRVLARNVKSTPSVVDDES